MVFKHDVNGNVETEHDPLGRIVQQSRFDVLGRSLAVRNMDTGTKTSISDCMDGSLYSGILGGPAQKTFLDALRRPIEIRVRQKPDDVTDIVLSRFIYEDNVRDALERNLVGRLIRVEDQAGVREVDAYDFKGNVLSETRQLSVEYKKCIDWTNEESIELEDSLRISTEYDAMNRPVLSNDMLNRVTRRTFDLLGNLASLSSKEPEDTEWVLHTKSIEYTADGLTSERELCDGPITRYIYDEDSRLLLRKTTRNIRGGKVEDITYTYDCAGRLTRSFDAAQETVFFRNQKLQAVKEYTYDAAGQLIRARGREQLQGNGLGVRSNPGSTGGGTPDGRQMVGYMESYTYDDAFNILVMSHQVSDAATQGWIRTYSYEAQSLIESEKRSNKVTSTVTAEGIETFTYNATGSMARMPGFSQITWDCLENMRSITRQVINDKSSTPETTWFTYDAEGNRVRKVTERAHATDSERGVKLKETKYVGTAQKNIVYAGDGTSTRKVTETSHIYGSLDSSPTVSIEKLEEGDALMRYLVSPDLEVDDQGSTVSYEEYSPFGASTLVCGKGITAPSDFRFASYRRDTETGLYHCGERYYCPRLARWTSADSLGTADGPNVYCYCGNDPVNYNDKQGTSRLAYLKDKLYAAGNAALPVLVNPATSSGIIAWVVADVMHKGTTDSAGAAAGHTLFGSALCYAGGAIATVVLTAIALTAAKSVARRCCKRDERYYDPKYKEFMAQYLQVEATNPALAGRKQGAWVNKQAREQGISPEAVYERLIELEIQHNAEQRNSHVALNMDQERRLSIEDVPNASPAARNEPGAEGGVPGAGGSLEADASENRPPGEIETMVTRHARSVNASRKPGSE